MSNGRLHPLERNPQSGEPFIRLRNHSNIIVTPPRLDDANSIVVYMNDDRVHEWLSGPPYPYLIDHAEAWISTVKKQCDDVLVELESAAEKDEFIFTEYCPVRYLREVQSDGSDILIGDIGFLRNPYGELLGTEGVDWDQSERVEQNNSLKLGDPKIIWSIGDFLAPSHHGQGIMTDAVGTMLHEWAIPRMGIHRALVAAFVGNIGSVRVFEKNGFRLTRTIENYKVVKGKMRGLHVLEWTLV